MFGGEDGMLICEPCNYVSNVAFYRNVIKACEYDWSTDSEMQHNLVKSVTLQVFGSFIMHGTNTAPGATLDN